MALRVWLSLNGNLNNQGLSSVTVTNNGATVNAAGKIGSCYSFGDGTDSTKARGINLNDNFSTLGTSRSISVWVYPKGNHLHYTGAIASSGDWNKSTRWAFGLKQDNSGITGFDSAFNTYYNTNIPTNTWTHLCVTVSNGVTKFYKNGEYLGEQSRGSGNLSSDVTNTMVGRETYGGGYFSFNGNLNDFRIYDHALSPKEVSEISKGLILHYKLDRPLNGLSGLNLVSNGWGGTDNWSTNTAASVSTSVPSTPAGMTNSYSAGNVTKEFIPIIQNHSYTISAYVKKNSSTASYCYLTLVPYDIDKLQINAYNQRDGFVVNSLTTLSQDLNSGDTIVHLTDASKWNNPSTYAIYVAIFGYKDSTGYEYPDLVYTRRTYAYGTTTDKTNIDIEHNQVTLLNPYLGEKIPAGTSVCLSSSGSGYYYAASTSAANATDWTLLTKTFIPNIVNYLVPTRYVKVMSLSSYQWIAGITLVDNTATNYITDCSGYGNDGTTISSLSLSSDSPRYNNSVEFNGTTGGILIENLNIGNIINTAITYSFWIKPNGENGARSVYFGSYSGVSFSIEKTTANKLRLYWNGTPDTTTNLSITDGEWQHIVITKNGTTEMKVYLNGSLVQTITGTFNNLTFPTTFRIGRDSRSNDGTPYKGLMSDFRIYSTVLSADDIKELYNTGTWIDNKYSIGSFEFDEINSGSNELNPFPYAIKQSGGSTYTLEYLPNGDFQMTGYIWPKTDLIPIKPTGKTYYYDVEYSNVAGNRLYIGFEKYDVNKGTGTNSECQYVVGTTSAANHVRATGTINLSTANGSTAAYTKLRLLNNWDNASGNMIGTIHHISLKEVSTRTVPDIKKTGVFDGDAFIEDSGSSISKTGNIIANQIIEI